MHATAGIEASASTKNKSRCAIGCDGVDSAFRTITCGVWCVPREGDPWSRQATPPAPRPSMDSPSDALERVRSSSSRFFGGLSVEETAEVLSVSRLTVMRDWNFSRAWLPAEMSGDKRQKSP